MKRLLCVLLATACIGRPAEFATALPGYRYEFPRDHFTHAQFRTEWWYWTGNLRTPEGRRFGFELTFFRNAATKQPIVAKTPWEITDFYLAHLTLSDIAGRRFHHFERLNRAGPGIAGADAASGVIWNGNWQGRLDGIQAVTESFRLELRFNTNKPPVIHGVDGVSAKAAGPGRASHYISFTRLNTSGTLQLEGQNLSVEGTAWMDHEFFTHQLEPYQSGWDWLSIQLDNGTELMLFRLRHKDGSIDPFSAGTFVDASGKPRHLSAANFRITPAVEPKWRGLYPLRWNIEVPTLNLKLKASTPLDKQELIGKSSLSPNYWEGAMDYAGTLSGRPIKGVGYLEMTGYDRPIVIGR